MTPVSSNGGPKVMVSNLPLLFARGSPTSLESMCLEELQLFLKFVLKCEQNVAAIDIDTLRQPPWWPKGVRSPYVLNINHITTNNTLITHSRLSGGPRY